MVGFHLELKEQALENLDYKTCLDYLKLTSSFQAYSPEEFELLEMIFELPEKKSDLTPEADAIRLYTAWLLYDNTQRNPKIKCKELDQKKVLEISQRYGSRIDRIPRNLKLSSHIQPSQLVVWDIFQKTKQGNFTFNPISNYAKGTYRQFNDSIAYVYKIFEPTSLKPLSLKTRPEQELMKCFLYYYLKASSPNSDVREEVKELVNAMQYDEYEMNPAMRICLEARLHLSEYPDQYETAIKELCHYLEIQIQNPNDQKNLKLINNHLKTAYQSLPEREIIKNHFEIENKPTEWEKLYLTLPLELLELPQKQERKRLPYSTDITFSFFESLHKQFFDSKKVTLPYELEEFLLEPKNGFEKEKIKLFLKDYEKGVIKKHTILRHSFKENTTEERALPLIKEKLELQYSKDIENAKGLENRMLQLANSLPVEGKERVIAKTKRLALDREALSIEECKALLLSASEEEYLKRTYLTEEKDILALHQLIGDYFNQMTLVQHHKRVLRLFSLLSKEKSETKQGHLIQELASELSRKREFDVEKEPGFLLIFEYESNILLYDHQVEGLRQMRSATQKGKNIILQRLQGKGKSSTWGPLEAFENADGFHLMIHVSPTATFPTDLNNMSHNSKQLFGQMEHTFQFDDSPKYFSSEYLSWIKNLLIYCMHHREYINLPPETLWAMRSKYIKIHFDEASEGSAQLFWEICGILRVRGLLTFDEVHLAFHPRKELNMPIGTPHSPNELYIDVIAQMLIFAILAVDKEGAPLIYIKENEHPKQSEKQRIQMNQFIVDNLLKKSAWKKVVKDKESLEEITSYFLGETDEIPKILDQETYREAAVLIHKMIGDGWLQKRLAKYADEGFGLPLDDRELPIAIPFLSNMKPATGSEFSDTIVMLTNTYIATLVRGISIPRVKELLEDIQNEAREEKKVRIRDNPNFSIRDCKCVKEFEKMSGLSLFTLDPDDKEVLIKVKSALEKRNTLSLKILFRYMKKRLFSQVELYDWQISSNGQNLASMGKNFVAYSGSLDNPLIAPPNTELQLDEGTNGQTVDLFLRKFLDFIIVSDKENAILDLLIEHEERDRILSFIDAGCYFRGLTNREAALLISAVLKKHRPKIKGTLFCNENRIWSCIDHHSGRIITLSGTSAEIIRSETGFKPSQRFTFYGQYEITGVDIVQDPDALALFFLSEITEIHKICQGPRRYRDLDKNQNIIPVTKKSNAKAIQSKLKKEGNLTKKDLITLSFLNEIGEQQPDIEILFLQKMENTVQQSFLDKSYAMSDYAERKKLFSMAESLFKKKTHLDLYQEYGKKREKLSMEEYLQQLKKKLLVLLDLSIFSEMEREKISLQLDGIIEEHRPYLSDRQGQGSTFNQESTMLHQRVTTQETEKVQDEEKVVDNDRLTEEERDLLHEKSSAEFIRLDKELFTKEETFLKITPFNGVLQDHPCISKNNFMTFRGKEVKIESELWRIAQVLENSPFSDQMLVSSNYAVTFKNQIDLLPPYRKYLNNVLLSYDEAAENKWQIVLISSEDASFLARVTKQHIPPKGKKWWLFRSNAKPIKTCGSPFDSNLLEEEAVQDLFIQTFIFTGNITLLDSNQWHERFKSWLERNDNKKVVRDFLEERVKRDLPSSYEYSKTYALLHKEE